MKFSNTGRIPNFVFEDKKETKMEKEAQFDDVNIPDFSDLGPQSFKEHLNDIAEMADNKSMDALDIQQAISDLYDQYEVNEGALAPENIGNPLDKAMSLVEKLTQELQRLSKLGKLAETENGIKKIAQMYWNGDDYYGEYPPDDLDERQKQESWESGQSEMESAFESDVEEDVASKSKFPELTDEFSGGSVVYTDFKIEPNPTTGGYELVGYGEYLPYSVRGGETTKGKVDFFSTLEEAKEKYPDVPVSESAGLPGKMIEGPMSDVPPSDFDPADAGESWNKI